MGQTIGPAQLRDVAEMGRLTVTTFLAAHRGQVPEDVPARRFYAAVGGEVVRHGEFEDSGYLLPEIVYGWSDTATLIAAAGGDASP